MGLIKALLEDRAGAKFFRQERAQQRRQAWAQRRASLLKTVVEKIKIKGVDWKMGGVSLLKAVQRPARRVWAAALTHRMSLACWVLSFLVGWGHFQLLDAVWNMASPLAVMPAKNVASAGLSIADPVFAKSRGTRQGGPVLVSTKVGLKNLADHLPRDGMQRDRWVAAVDRCFSKGECHQETASLAQSWQLVPAAGKMNWGERAAERHFLNQEHVIFAWPKADELEVSFFIVVLLMETGFSIWVATLLLLARHKWKKIGLQTDKSVQIAELYSVIKSMGVLGGLVAGGLLLIVGLVLAGCTQWAAIVSLFQIFVFFGLFFLIAGSLRLPANQVQIDRVRKNIERGAPIVEREALRRIVEKASPFSGIATPAATQDSPLRKSNSSARRL